MKLRINRNSIINCMIFFVTLIVCFVLLEQVVRKIYPQYDPSGNIVFEKKGDGLVLAPANFSGRQWRNSGDFNVGIEINQYGFRDQKDLVQSRSKDIFIVGDSFSFGHGVEEKERFGNVFQELMKDSIHVFNMGISHSHFLNYEKHIEYAKNKGANIQNIILGVCMANDIHDYDALSKIKSPSKPFNRLSAKDWLNKKSCLYNFIAYRLQSNQMLRIFLVKMGLVKSKVSLTASTIYGKKLLDNSANQLQTMLKGYNHLIIIIPLISNWKGERRRKITEEHAYFISQLQKRNLSVLDIKPVFESQNPDPVTPFHFQHDYHWNKKGHQLVGESIFREWNKKKNPLMINQSSEDSEQRK